MRIIYAPSGLARFSYGYGWRQENFIIAERSDGFQRHVAGASHGPFVVLFEQDVSDEARKRFFVWKDTRNVGSALDLAVQTLDGIGRVRLDEAFLRERRIGQGVFFGVVDHRRQFGNFGAQLIGDLQPLLTGGLSTAPTRPPGRRPPVNPDGASCRDVCGAFKPNPKTQGAAHR